MPRVYAITPIIERLERHYVPEPMSGCWLWIGACNAPGYGRFVVNGVLGYAHRASYEARFGPMAPGLELDHLCRVPCCINPQHLEPVTCRENLLRGKTLAARNAAATHCPKGHPYDASNTAKFGGRTTRRCRECGRISTRRYLRQRRMERT